MDIDKLEKELTTLHMMALYDFIYPIDYNNFNAAEILNRESDAIERFQNDPIFYARVRTLVAHTLRAVERANVLPGGPH